MGTGVAVSTGDVLTAAKQNLKMEDGTSLASLGILDQSGAGAEDLRFVCSENLSANRNLTITVNDAARTIDLGGNLTLAGALTTAAALTTSGAFALTLTVTNTTNATIPAGTVTLMDLGTAQTVTGAKRFADNAVLIENPATTFYYTVQGAAIAANRALSLPLLAGDDTIVTADFIQTLTNKTLTAPTITGGTHTAITSLGIRSTGAAFDLTIASSEVFTAGRTLTITLNNAARTLDLGGNLVLAATLTTVNANAITLTTSGATALTLPTAGTLAILGANTFTAAQTLDGDVDTVLNITTSPIIDIGADVFSTGTFIDIAYDTAETLTGALIGINLDLSSNVTISNQSVTGIDVTLPATFGNGTEYGIRVRGDGQTILIGNDADLYLSLAKASSVDILIQGISPVVDIGVDVLVAGYIISIDYDTAETTTGDLYIVDALRAANALTLGGDLYGVNLDFNTNVVAAADRDIFGYRVTTPALTSAGANTTAYFGFQLAVAGALVMNNGGGAITWYGVDIVMPNITQTAGNMTAVGIRLTEGTTTSGTINAININGVGVDTIINFSVSPVFDIGADVLSAGTIIDFQFDTAETATGELIGSSMNMNTNLTPLGGQGVIAYTAQTPAFTNTDAAATAITGYHMNTVGALVMNNAGGAIRWYGLDMTMPNITQTAGEMTAIGIRLTEGTTTSGTINAININGSVDTIINFSASPVVDIGADVFPTGYFMDLSFDTIETLTAQLTGIRVDWDTVIVSTGGAGTGNITAFWADMGQLAVNGGYNATIYGIRLDLDFTVGGAETIYGASIVMPAAYGTGTEVGIHYTGDGQTINIGNDADLFVSFAKANSVDINIQGVTPVIDIGADVFNTGTIIDFAFDTAEIAAGALVGVSINMNTNLTPLSGQNVTGFTTQTAAFTNAAATATVLTGFQLPTAGALVSNDAGATLTWYGVDLQMPNITQTSGTMVASGIRITEGTTTSGTATAININVTRAISLAKASDIIVVANTAAALDFNNGTTNFLRFNTQVGTSGVVMATFTSCPATFASAAGSTYSVVAIPAFTLTLTGGTGVTALNGLGLYIGSPTVTSEDATTVTTASTLYLGACGAAGGGPAAITNNYIINTSVAGCFLTAAGVWTDTSTRAAKTDIMPVNYKDMPNLLDMVTSVRFRYLDKSDGGYLRFGLIAEDVPDFLATPSHKGLAAMQVAGFALAGVKYLKGETESLTERVERLEKEKTALVRRVKKLEAQVAV